MPVLFIALGGGDSHPIKPYYAYGLIILEFRLLIDLYIKSNNILLFRCEKSPRPLECLSPYLHLLSKNTSIHIYSLLPSHFRKLLGPDRILLFIKNKGGFT